MDQFYEKLVHWHDCLGSLMLRTSCFRDKEVQEVISVLPNMV
jgi:hypothetical protein